MLSLKTAFSGKIENSTKFSKAGIKPPILANHSAANPQRDRQFQFPTDASVFHRSLPKYLMPTHLQTNPSKPAQSNSFTRRHFNVVSINVDLPPTLIFINAFSVYAELIFLSSFIFEMVNPNNTNNNPNTITITNTMTNTNSIKMTNTMTKTPR